MKVNNNITKFKDARTVIFSITDLCVNKTTHPYLSVVYATNPSISEY